MLKPYLHRVHVSPVGSPINDFPIDMLRLDELSPSSKEDSLKIMRCFWKKGENFIEKPIITLERVTWKTWEPTYKKWNSFLWTIVKHEVI